MGNICSRSSNEDEAFAGPGRVVGAPPAGQSAAPRASVPASTTWKNTPGRTLGESSPHQGDGDEARSNAAIAAQANLRLALQKRAEALSSTNKGKLGTKLAAQKAKTQTQTLNEASHAELAARDDAEVRKATEWN
ncbi:uncharacterized protein N7482_007438 [Penicillium canariense]|uniref:Uncharacterized protein n=1 Tax=Penicillium canariense TaxID=189055 RepID=A0A9W9HY58_9EURO|nr:uncharacterized protein N7482_007438 [Penicillium canariense]KAJ5160434.1 hypothetical protein N7482_007438 [Penicillium canariense]